MKMGKILVAVLIAVTGMSLFNCKKKDGGDLTKLVFATDATWPPMQMFNEEKQIVGFDIDFIKAVGEAVGFQVEIINAAWDGIFMGLNGGKYDAVISSVTITDERKQQMDFSIPYINAGQVIIVRAESDGMETISDFEGKRMGAQIGTTGAFEISKNDKVLLSNYDELGLAIEDLVNGRLDGVVADTPIAADYALQNPGYKGKLKIVGKPFTDEFYGIAVKRGNRKVLDLINAGVEKVLGTDVYSEIEDKWLR